MMNLPGIGATLACFCGLVQPVFSAESFTGSEPARSIDAAWAEIDEIFASFAKKQHIPGLVVGLVRNGKLERFSAFGVQDLDSGTPVNQDTVFRIASLTKSFTALALLNLRDSGTLGLHDAATQWVPELNFMPQTRTEAGAEAGSEVAAVRLRELLTHSAGLVTDDPWGDRQLDMSETEFSTFLSAGIPLARPSGEAFEYSNTGYTILGRVISNASKRTFQEYINQILLQPLHMDSTSWEVGEVPAGRMATGYSWLEEHHEVQAPLSDGAFGAMAGLSTSAADYGLFVAWLLSAFGEQPGELAGSVKAATVREAGRGVIFSQLGQRSANAAVEPGDMTCPVVWMYGAGFYVVHDCELGKMLRHPGGLPGYGSQVLLLPGANVGIFAFANLTYAPLSGPVVEAALQLKKAGLLDQAQVPISAELQRAVDSALRIYQSGDIHHAQDELADNLLLDRSADRRNADLRHLRELAGECSSFNPIEILNAHAGRFGLTCEHGSLNLAILLSPTNPPRIQYLEFESVPQTASQ